MTEPRRRAHAGSRFFRRAPFLVSYWQGKQLYFENFLTRKKIAASLETAALLDFFSGWKREEAVFRRWPEYTHKSLRRAVRRLAEESFLQHVLNVHDRAKHSLGDQEQQRPVGLERLYCVNWHD